MDLTQSSEEWTKTHFAVNDLLSELLNELRNLGYNPSYHLSYNHAEHHVTVDAETLAKHPKLNEMYRTYVDACNRRNDAVERIQELPKIDLGF